jgi:hypothetical protein
MHAERGVPRDRWRGATRGAFRPRVVWGRVAADKTGDGGMHGRCRILLAAALCTAATVRTRAHA